MSTAISMVPVKARMKTPDRYMSTRPPIDHLIVSYMADNLGDPLSPEGFALGAELALEKLLKGPDAFTRQRLHELMESGEYPRFGELVIYIAEAFCPTDFTSGVRNYYNGLATHIRESPERR